MAEQDTAPNGAAVPTENAPAGAQFTVEKIYLKDVSFEAPGAPQVFTEQGQPQLQMNLSQKAQRVAENAWEVVLGVTLTCTIAEKTAYLAEVQQAGVFGLVGFDERALDAMLGTHCPNTLYPFAREAISELVTKGGFPPLLLQPLNFDAIYAQAMPERAARGNAPAAQAAPAAAGGETH